LEAVLVSGEQPGPGLWKVSKDDHTMWILGIYGPLPKDMTWRAKNVESLIAESQEVVAPVKINRDINTGFWLQFITLMPAMLRADKNPNNASLQDVLPADLYAQWLTQREKYFAGDDRFEKFRPTFAAQELQIASRKRAGFDDIDRSMEHFSSIIGRAASKHHVRVTTPKVTLKITIDKPRQALKNFAKINLPDVQCFADTINGLDADIAALKLRANAWARGEIDELRRLFNVTQEVDCVAELQNAALIGSLGSDLGVQPAVDKLKAELLRVALEARQKWLAAAEHALANNATTFAMLPIDQLLRADGYLNELRLRGYRIEEP
jgi:hypothetical protein